MINILSSSESHNESADVAAVDFFFVYLKRLKIIYHTLCHCWRYYELTCSIPVNTSNLTEKNTKEIIHKYHTLHS